MMAYLNWFSSKIIFSKNLARLSTGVFAMGVFTVWRYQTDIRSKILLLFHLFFSNNKFQLAISTDHQFASITIAQEGFFFFFLEMSVNANHYRAAIGVFNNRSFILLLKNLCTSQKLTV